MRIAMVETYHRGAYYILTGLCVMMVAWILGLPGSWRAGWDWHDRYIREWFDSTSDFPTPLNLITKYKGHTLVQMCHILPGALWAGIIPFQLHPGFRKRYRRAHRASGYVFAFTACIMMVGFYHIVSRKLTYMHTDFPSLELDAHTTWLPFRIPHEPVFTAVGVWFLWTMGMAVWHAINSRTENHRAWILRHVASGIWVALQRLFVAAVRPKGPENQKKTFGDGALIGLVLTVCAAEAAIYGYAEIRRISRARREGKGA